MTQDRIVSRMNELGLLAQTRIDATAHHPEKVYAEIMHMAQEDVSEMLQLRLALPSSGEERGDVIARIQTKINIRKSRLSALQGEAVALE